MSIKGERVTVRCEICGKSRDLPIYRVRQGKGKYCSPKCKGVANAIRLNATRPSPKTYADKLRGYQRSGAESPSWQGGGTEFICKNCGRTFKRETYRLKSGNGHTGDYCSKFCRNEYRNLHESGEQSPFWVGGPKTYRGRNWLRARAGVVADQSGMCADCGRVVGESLPVHHIRPYREFESYAQANERSNLIGLCQSCHMKREPRKTKLDQPSQSEHH